MHPLAGGLAALLLAGAAHAAGPPIPRLISTTALGTVTQNPQIYGRDGTYSTLIGGRSYWTFGDTSLHSANASGKNFIDNTLSWTESLDGSQGITLDHDQTDASGLPARFIPFTADEANYNATHDPAHCTARPCGANLALWPGPIAYDPASNQVIVSFGEIQRVTGQSGWTTVGGGLATGTINPDGSLALTRPVQNPTGPYPTLMWTGTETEYDDVAFISNGFYYAYGDHRTGLTHHFRLARVPLAQLLTKSAWQYYAGHETWSSDPAAAISVFNGGAAGNSVFYNAFLGEWMAIYTAPLSNSMYYRVALRPEGPWSAETFLLQGLNGWQNNVDYAGRAHPEFSPDGGQTIPVAYAHTTGFLQQDLPLTLAVFAKPGQ
jgi:hypothetical protein